jgi:hypothetical protein
MSKKGKQITIAGAIYALFFAAPHVGIVNRQNDNKCGGTERWEQKVLIDSNVDEVRSRPKLAEIDSLDGINTSAIKIGLFTPRQPMEDQVYTIKNCFISEAFREKDDDIHLVIEDGHHHHMIAEIPDPTCPDAKQSDFITNFKKARTTFLKYQSNYNHYRFNITGVLFIDKKHPNPPTGDNENNIELHPVIKLEPTTTSPQF